MGGKNALIKIVLFRGVLGLSAGVSEKRINDGSNKQYWGW